MNNNCHKTNVHKTYCKNFTICTCSVRVWNRFGFVSVQYNTTLCQVEMIFLHPNWLFIYFHEFQFKRTIRTSEAKQSKVIPCIILLVRTPSWSHQLFPNRSSSSYMFTTYKKCPSNLYLECFLMNFWGGSFLSITFSVLVEKQHIKLLIHVYCFRLENLIKSKRPWQKLNQKFTFTNFIWKPGSHITRYWFCKHNNKMCLPFAINPRDWASHRR